MAVHIEEGDGVMAMDGTAYEVMDSEGMNGT
jgi:hypothetical protein